MEEFSSYAINGLTENGRLTNVLGRLGGPDYVIRIIIGPPLTGKRDRRVGLALMTLHLKRVSQ
jgi:hypothetical protein